MSSNPIQRMRPTHTRARLAVSNVAAVSRMPAAKAFASIHAATNQAAASAVAPGTPIRESIAANEADTPVTPLPRQYDERFRKWIPLVVPMFAVMLAAGAYFILGSVL